MDIEAEAFHSPPVEYRGSPFWVWNDTMEEERFVEQVESMADAGWGGFFPHARFGNVVDCLSEEWFEKVARSVEAGVDAGMEPWLYDEDHWPSGYAGGSIPALGPEYRVKCLSLKSEPTAHDDVLEAVEHEGSRYAICVTTAGRDSEKTARGTPYVDLLNPDVVEEFLDRSYERYADAVGEHFGDGVRGIFTDEPQLYAVPEAANLRGFVPWTAGLPTAFKEEYGYDLTDHLAALFFDRETGGRSPEAVRYDFWRFVTERFVETFSERLGEWCRERGLELTGHYQHEHSIPEQIRTSGAVMPHYRHQGRPGIDHLGRAVVNRQNNPLKAKQCSSVARQFGRRALCELYGTSGQQLSFEERKWLADWNFVHGITFVNHHLSLYSMRGERKRDYPPNLFYQQPWWTYNDRIADYVARTAYVLEAGDAFADTLLVHPVQTGWITYTNASEDDLSNLTGHHTMANERIQGLNERFNALVDHLLGEHVHFDLGDELIAEDEGTVEDGQFVVGEARYDTVVLPYCRTLQASTAGLIEEFIETDGTVLVVGSEPSMIEGRPGEGRLDDLVGNTESATAADVVDRARRPVRLLNEEGAETASDVMITVREDEDGLVAFLANPDRESATRFILRFDREGSVERWDAETGEQYDATATVRDGGTETVVELPPTGSLLIALEESGVPEDDGTDLRLGGPSRPTAAEVSATSGSSSSEPEDTIPLDGEWYPERHDPNQLVIDECDLELDGKDFGETNVAAHWQEKTELEDPAGHVPFSATYSFQVAESAAGGKFGLVVESADQVNVQINGTELRTADERWRDIHWHRFDVSDCVRAGSNMVTVEGTRSETVSVEPIYVLGNFAVTGKTHRLVPEPETIPEPEITANGYPFFTGEMTLRTTVTSEENREGTFEFDGLDAVFAEVAVGDERGECYWPPWSMPVELESGGNVIEVRLATSLRNLTGPLHADDPTPTFTTPESFRPDGTNPYLERNTWVDEYTSVPVGLENPRLLVFGGD